MGNNRNERTVNRKKRREIGKKGKGKEVDKGKEVKKEMEGDGRRKGTISGSMLSSTAAVRHSPASW